MTVGKGPLLGIVERFAGELRFPQLFLLTGVLFVLDVLIPDLIPFADEILLGLVTLLLANWKRRPRPAADGAPAGRPDAPVIDVTPVAADDSERDGRVDE